MSIITIILFFLYSWGFGFTATKFVKNSDNLWERNMMRIGIGLPLFFIISVLLNLIHIPLDWKIFLFLSMAFPLYCIIDGIKKKKIRIKKEDFKIDFHLIILLIIFLSVLFMYASGAFKYGYLEDDDPWAYSEASKYVSAVKNLNPEEGYFKFLNPYPPAYASLFGILHQTSSSISWTLKFFNALIISLGILFFYFAVKQLTKNETLSLSATFILAVIPSFFTHFIWAIALAVPLFFIMLYCLEKTDDDPKWVYTSMAVISGFMMTHPSKILKIMVLISIYFLIKSLAKKKFLKNVFFGVIGGIAVSGLWWFNKWQALFLERAVGANVASSAVADASIFIKIKDYLFKVFSPMSGTATRPYTFNDFFIAKSQGLINIPPGLGIFASILLILGIIYIIKNYKQIIENIKKGEDYWIPVVLAWFIITFMNVNSATFNLPIGFFSFRTWLLLAIPVALLGSLGLKFALNAGNKAGIPSMIILLIVVFGLLFTSGYQKFSLNTANWPPGQGWVSIDEVQTHLWLKTLPDNSKVFSCGNTPVIGFDKYSCEWCEDELAFREEMFEKTPEEVYSFLKPRGYEYILVSGAAYIKFGAKYGNEEAKKKIDGFFANLPSNLYAVAYESNGGAVLKLI